MLDMALQRDEPAAIRYNRGSLMEAVGAEPLIFGRWETILPVSAVTVVATGCMVELALPVARETGAGLLNARFLHELDAIALETLRAGARRVLVLEDGIASFGIRMKAALSPLPVRVFGVENQPVMQGTISQQRERFGMTADALRRAILEDA